MRCFLRQHDKMIISPFKLFERGFYFRKNVKNVIFGVCDVKFDITDAIVDVADAKIYVIGRQI